MKKIIISICLILSNLLSAQNLINSNTRKFMEAELTFVVRDWNKVANLKSGTGETVSFFPIEITDLKTDLTIKALQVDMSVDCRGFTYTKSSWVDLNEISEFLNFIKNYVVPNISYHTEHKKSINYIFKSKEIVVSYIVEEFNNKLSVYLKNDGEVNEECYFWTENQINKSEELVNVLESLNK